MPRMSTFPTLPWKLRLILLASLFAVVSCLFADTTSELVIKKSVTLAVYPVANGILQNGRMKKSLYPLPQNTPENHKKIWHLVQSLLPEAMLKQHLVRFKITTDGIGNSLASVYGVNPNNNNDYEFEIDLIDTLDDRGRFRDLDDLRYSILHESGHLLTLNDSQVKWVDAPIPNMPTYFTDEGQTLPDSYLNLFVQRFWNAALLKQSHKTDRIKSQKRQDAAVAAFYQRHPDQFLTEYAATNPEEDIAESWSQFILKPKPAGRTPAEQKILFFYDHPELVQMRNTIRKAATIE